MQVPAHWKVAPLGRVGGFSKGGGGTKEDEVSDGVPCIRYGDLYSKYDTFITAARSFVTPERAADYTPVRFGDVLFAASGETLDEIGKSAVNLMQGPVCCGGDVLIFRPSREVNARFLGYVADCPSSVHQKARMGRGVTVMHIYADELKHLRVALPPLNEQVAIVRVLDHAGRRIQGAIRAKQKLIALLNEQKQAVIDRAVTCGLDPNVRLKPSGVEWLGDAPGHWEVAKLKQHLGAPLAYGVLKPDKYTGADGVPIIRILDVVDGAVCTENLEQISPSQDAEFSRTRVLAGDVIISVVGTIGRSTVIPNTLGPANLSRALCRVQLADRLMPAFLLLYLQSRVFLNQAESVPAGTAQRVLNLGDLRQFDIAAPPVVEQQEIVRTINKSLREISATVTGCKDAITLLREYRIRLIADVVTGRLDVGEAAARLPDEFDELEPLDDSGVEASESELDELGAVEP